MKAKLYLEHKAEDMASDLMTFINIPSVIDEDEGNKPFGTAIDNALKWVLNRCEAMGMRTFYDPEGYYGFAEVGSGEELIGILMHVDVVPGGDRLHWTTPPFESDFRQGKIFGRGAIDDKGPIVSVLYAMDYLIHQSQALKKRVRLIFGTDEETHWRGICKYMKNEEVPQMGFTPDSVFPVVYAEKALLQLRLKHNVPVAFTVRGGKALNAVPEFSTYKGLHLHKLEKELKKLGFDHDIDNDELYVIGRSAHSAKPYLGINAITRMALGLSQAGVTSHAIRFLSEKIGLTHHGELIFGHCADEASGKLTFSVNQIDIGSHGEFIGIDVRIPVTISADFILQGLKRVLEKYHLDIEILDQMPALYMPKDHRLIQILTDVYADETGLDASPQSTGGATYARAMPHCVAFGPLFPGQEKVAHQTDEYIELKSMVQCAVIYAKAIERLAEEDI